MSRICGDCDNWVMRSVGSAFGFCFARFPQWAKRQVSPPIPKNELADNCPCYQQLTTPDDGRVLLGLFDAKCEEWKKVIRERGAARREVKKLTQDLYEAVKKLNDPGWVSNLTDDQREFKERDEAIVQRDNAGENAVAKECNGAINESLVLRVITDTNPKMCPCCGGVLDSKNNYCTNCRLHRFKWIDEKWIDRYETTGNNEEGITNE